MTVICSRRAIDFFETCDYYLDILRGRGSVSVCVEELTMRVMAGAINSHFRYPISDIGTSWLRGSLRVIAESPLVNSIYPVNHPSGCHVIQQKAWGARKANYEGPRRIYNPAVFHTGK